MRDTHEQTGRLGQVRDENGTGTTQSPPQLKQEHRRYRHAREQRARRRARRRRRRAHLASAASQILRREFKYLQKQWNQARVDQALQRRQVMQLREEAEEARRKAAEAESRRPFAAKSRIMMRELRAAARSWRAAAADGAPLQGAGGRPPKGSTDQVAGRVCCCCCRSSLSCATAARSGA